MKMKRLTDYLTTTCLSLPVKDKEKLISILSRSVRGDVHEAQFQRLMCALYVMIRIFGIDIRKRCRLQEYAELRAVFCYRMRMEGIPYKVIGKIVERDHSTAMLNCRRMDDALKYPHAFPELVHKFNQFDEALDDYGEGYYDRKAPRDIA